METVSSVGSVTPPHAVKREVSDWSQSTHSRSTGYTSKRVREVSLGLGKTSRLFASLGRRQKKDSRHRSSHHSSLESLEKKCDNSTNLWDEEDHVRRVLADAAADWKEECSADFFAGDRSCLIRFVENPRFEACFSSAILMNSIFIGISVEYDTRNPSSETPVVLHMFNHFFAYLFFVELLIRMAAEGFRFLHIRNPSLHWNCFDLIVVGISMSEVALDYAKISANQSGSNMRIMRMLRVVRLMRVLRITRLVRLLGALRSMVTSIISTFKTLFWAMVLLTVLIYFFGVLFAQAVHQHLSEHDFFAEVDAYRPHEGVPLCQEDLGCTSREKLERLHFYWGGVITAMFTLFKVITNGVSWELSLESVEDIQPLGHFWILAFVFYVFFTNFAVLNVMTGVFCQSAIDAAQHDHESVVHSVLANKELFVNQMRRLFKSMDTSNDGRLTIAEFEKHLNDRRVQAYFHSLDLDSADAWTLFKLLDSDGTHVVEIDEFVSGCLRLKGNAKSIDMAQLLHEHKWMMKRLATFMVQTEQQFLSLSDRLGALAQIQPLALERPHPVQRSSKKTVPESEAPVSLLPPPCGKPLLLDSTAVSSKPVRLLM